MKQTDPSPSLAAAQDLLSAKWSIPILRALADGPVRFSGIRRLIPAISATLLGRRLRDLEAAGVVALETLPAPADCQVYVLTPVGEAARPILHAIEQWAPLLEAQLGNAPPMPVTDDSP